jgi:predicted nucleic acid-binding protein
MPRVRETPVAYQRRRILFDTSVVVGALVEAHPHHERAHPWLLRVLAGEVALVMATHGLAETYSALTRVPTTPPLAPDQASTLISDILLKTCRATVVQLDAEGYLKAMTAAARAGLRGGIIHDAVIAQCACKARIPLLTFNRRDFIRVVDPTTEILDP